MYDLSTDLDCETVAQTDPGTSVLVAGPAMTGKEVFAKEFLVDAVERGEGALIVTTGDSVQDVVEDCMQRVQDASDIQLGIVDCRAKSTAGRKDDAETPPGLHIHHVNSPDDLTGIGIGVVRCLESLYSNGAETGHLVFSSLSTLLLYTDRESVFKFCHVLTSRLDAAGYTGVFTIDTGAHDEQTIEVIKQAFDAVVEISESDDGRKARVNGMPAIQS